jgi:hypothetical protein
MRLMQERVPVRVASHGISGRCTVRGQGRSSGKRLPQRHVLSLVDGRVLWGFL